MTAVVTPLPARRADLRIESGILPGKHVVKDPRSGGFFLLGDQEHFLLTQLDGERDADAVRQAFERRFQEPLAESDLSEFMETAREQGILTSSVAPPPPRQHLFYWRKRLWNPDRLFTRLAPKLGFLWTRGFVAISLAAMLVAGFVLWANRAHLGVSMRDSVRWDSLFWGWLVLLFVRGLHECAHGLTCKRYGGEVSEIGLLLLCLMPCFYCNVSDAWMFREKRKRVLVMLAGAYCDLTLWALAVFLWRVTEPGTLVHRVSFLILGLSGIDSLFNFNPLIKLDGYYVVSDWKELPNLRRRALERVMAHARRLLWGAPAPEREEHGRFLTVFGILSWSFSTLLVTTTLVVFTKWITRTAGVAGVLIAAFLAVPTLTGLFQGISSGELWRMVMRRHIRTACWLVGLGGIAATLCLVEVEEYVGGTFTVRPTVREEVRGRMAGFLREVCVTEGQAVQAGELIGRLEVPDLDCRLQQRRAELREAEAQLCLLECGTRPEEIAEQKGRVERMITWHAQGARNLERTRKMVDEELASFDQRIAEARSNLSAAETAHARVQTLFAAKAAAVETLEKSSAACEVARARLSLAGAEKRACEARGTGAAEEELAEREKELGDERGKLALLEAGGRPEEIDAQKARVERLQVDVSHLERLHGMLELRSTVAGTVVSPRLREKVGTYVREGDVICCVEGADRQEAEVVLEEAKLRQVRQGQSVRFKARALAFDTLEGSVTGVAFRADKDATTAQSSVVVYCSLTRSLPVLRTSMSGYARVYTGRRTLGTIAVEKTLRLVRTEFWW